MMQSLRSSVALALFGFLGLGAIPGANGQTLDGFRATFDYAIWCIAMQTDTVQANGQILAGGEFLSFAGQPRGQIARINPDGTLDEGFQPVAEGGEVNCFIEQPDGKLLVGGRFRKLAGQSCRGLARLNADGTLDNSFVGAVSTWVNTVCLQTDGRILAGGDGDGGYALVRVLQDGRSDASFGAKIRQTSDIDAVAIQPDGKILGAGWQIVELGKCHIARWSNTDPATESFSFNGTDIIWLRGGTGPEFYRTTFEACTNGTSWTDLGIGSRIDGGWQIAGLTLPDNATIVARGYAQGGLHNNSTWFVEKVLGPPAITLQPTNPTTIGGSNALFSASGYADSFQWLKDGQPLADGGDISGATTAALSIGTAFGADSGSYQVVLSNANGAVTSSVATLTVLEPYITAHPASQVAHIAQTVTLSGRGFGTEPLAYEWRRNGATIPGATESTLVLTIDWGDIGNYELVVSNAYGRAISSIATITAEVAPDDSFTNAVYGQMYGLALQSDGAILCGTIGESNPD